MKQKHAARVIHPRAPWAIPGSKVPAPVPQQAAPQPQQAPQPGTMKIGPGPLSPRAQAHLDSAKDTRLVDPPRVPASDPTTALYIDGAKVSVPSDWQIAYSSAKGKDTVYCVEPSSGKMHVLTLDGHGRLRELSGLSSELIDDLFRWRFPRFKR